MGDDNRAQVGSESWLDADPSDFDPFADPAVDITRLGDPEPDSPSHTPSTTPDSAELDAAAEHDQAGGPPSADVTIFPRYYVRIDDGRCIGLETSVLIGRVGSAALVGADARVVVTVDDPTVSREHILVELNDGGVLVRDLGSTNGSAVVDDGGLIGLEPNVDIPIQFGDTVRFGDRSFVLELRPSGDPDLTATV